MQVEDHWIVPLLGGECRLVETDGLVNAIEFSKGGMPASMAMSIEDTPHGRTKATIRGNDKLLPLVRDHINRTFSFLQCYFDSNVTAKAVKIDYEPESEDEKS